ncbi:hypothetical protein [Pseudomonas eucalypticola]|uniref:Lipoprotein n=1 Tax=Pseudomonas eucalypticola TaxID=2599595 RepID=A0A7D5D986_9PSED|nr:hypothetical protein [Pseudomonas eucalypticola]QKZ05932.1 hypothetical protein HWQ56_19935 [Pseudomonas eucalypticola]
MHKYLAKLTIVAVLMSTLGGCWIFDPHHGGMAAEAGAVVIAAACRAVALAAVAQAVVVALAATAAVAVRAESRVLPRQKKARNEAG